MERALLSKARYFFGNDLIENEPLAGHCSFGIGGPARLFLPARKIPVLPRALAFCRENSVPFVVLGRGTNVLIPDSGFDGLVICLRAGALRFDGNTIVAEAGASLRKVASAAAERGLAGLEFAAGIPGSIGGGAIMNAGAHGRCIGSFLHEVSAIDSSGSQLRLTSDQIHFGHRESSLQQLPGVLTAVTLVLREAPPSHIKRTMQELLNLRRIAQPIRARSAGSVFKNPSGDSAGRLIELAGCKGMRCGGAVVSRKHANFILNCGGATCRDVKKLIESVRRRVRKIHGVDLQLEIVELGARK